MKLDHNLIVFITGGASGLGEATVRHLNKFGCRIAIADLNVERMEMLQKELGADKITWFECDVTDEESVKAAVEGTVKHYGTFHVAIPCAGVAWPLQTLTSKKLLDTELYKKVLDINLMGSVYVAKYASH